LIEPAASGTAGKFLAQRLLVVEDSSEVAELVTRQLADVAREVIVLGNGEEALRAAERTRFDLIVLDLMLPGLGGLEICRSLRAAGDTTPILILTARATELDRIVGLEYGADDYVIKPFSVLELVARVKALLRRVGTPHSAGVDRDRRPVRFGDFMLDPRSRELLRGETRIPLTAKEFDLLYLLAANPGRVYARSQLLDLVWGYAEGIYEHTVNSHINRLRAKIETDPSAPAVIETVWGVGYRLSPRLVP
jgi:DNA-binding response OmpR family regulator